MYLSSYLSEEKEVKSVLEALQGARDIIAETVSEDAIIRESMRELFKRNGIIKSRVIRGKEEAGEKFEDYFQADAHVKAYRKLEEEK